MTDGIWINKSWKKSLEIRRKQLVDNVKVSVIVPIYNVEDYIKECLESLERQIFNEIEVIMVNDGSTDDSGRIARKFAERNHNFVLIDQNNRGLSAARNAGLQQAKGEYVYFLDSDDLLTDGAINELYQRASSEDLDVLKFGAYVFEDRSKELKWTTEEGYKYKGEYPGVYEGLDLLGRFIANGDTAFSSCCLIFTKKSMIEKEHLRFCKGIIHEDNLFHWQLLSLSKRVAVLNKPLYCRRYRKGSITQTVDWKNRIRSMCVSAVTGERFLNAHPDIKGEISDWYIMRFIFWMIDDWQKLPLEIRNDSEVKEYYKRVKKIAKSHKYGNSKRIWLFMFNKRLFELYLWRTAAD